jgi:hypothetical protein
MWQRNILACKRGFITTIEEVAYVPAELNGIEGSSTRKSTSRSYAHARATCC